MYEGNYNMFVTTRNLICITLIENIQIAIIKNTLEMNILKSIHFKHGNFNLIKLSRYSNGLAYSHFYFSS